MTIKVNGMTISVENTNVAYDYKDIEKDSIAIESMSNNINKSIEALNIISNIKAVESFGYKSTEGVGENIKQGLTNIGEKIKNLFDKIIQTITNLIQKNVIKIQLNTATKKLQSAQGQTKCQFDPSKWQKFDKKKKETLAMLDAKNEVQSSDIDSILNVGELRGVVDSINAPSSLVPLYTGSANNDATETKENSVVAPIAAISTAVKDANNKMNDMLSTINKIREAAVKAKTMIQQPATAQGDQDVAAAEKEKMTKMNKLSSICGKVTSLIMIYVSAVTSFSFSNDEDSQPQHPQQQVNDQSAAPVTQNQQVSA